MSYQETWDFGIIQRIHLRSEHKICLLDYSGLVQFTFYEP